MKKTYRYLKKTIVVENSDTRENNVNGWCLYEISVDNGAAGVYLEREAIYRYKVKVKGSKKKAYHVLADRLLKKYPEARVTNWSYWGQSGLKIQSIVLESFAEI